MILATNVLDAFQKIRENNIDVIVADVFMPGVDGMELLKFLKEGIHAHMIPIIMMTGKNDADLKRRALKLGAVEFLDKPLKREQFLACLESFLWQKESRGSSSKN